MSNHDFLSRTFHSLPARRLQGLMAFMGAALLLLPGAARAFGTVVGADGAPTTPPASMLPEFAAVFVYALLLFAIPPAILLALNWGAQAAWKAAFKTQPPFGFFSVSSVAVSLFIAALGIFVIPAFKALFDSFGTDLAERTRLLMNYSYLLPILVLVMPLLLVVLKNNPRRERYFAAIFTGELAFMVLIFYAMYLMPFSFRETISG